MKREFEKEIEAVAERFGLSREDLMSPSKNRHVDSYRKARRALAVILSKGHRLTQLQTSEVMGYASSNGSSLARLLVDGAEEEMFFDRKFRRDVDELFDLFHLPRFTPYDAEREVVRPERNKHRRRNELSVAARKLSRTTLSG